MTAGLGLHMYCKAPHKEMCRQKRIRGIRRNSSHRGVPKNPIHGGPPTLRRLGQDLDPILDVLHLDLVSYSGSNPVGSVGSELLCGALGSWEPAEPQVFRKLLSQQCSLSHVGILL